jgi:hypothetical protein
MCDFLCFFLHPISFAMNILFPRLEIPFLINTDIYTRPVYISCGHKSIATMIQEAYNLRYNFPISRKFYREKKLMLRVSYNL